MRNLSVPPLLAVLISCVAMLAPVRADEDPGALFMKAYQEFRNGDQLEQEGQTSKALTKYRFCAELLEQIQKNNPDYNQLVIDYRLGKSREAIARVQAALNGGGLPQLPPSLKQDQPPALPQVSSRPMPSGGWPSLRIPVPGRPNPSPAATPPASFTGSESVVGQGAGLVLSQEVEFLKRQLVSSQQQVADLESQLLQQRAETQSAYKELDLTKVQVVEMKSRLAQTGQRLENLELENQTFARKSAEDDKRVSDLEGELEEVRADLEVVEDYNDELFAKLEHAAEFIEKSEGIRNRLLEERKELSAELAQTDEQRDGELKKQIDELVAKNQELEKDASQVPGLELQNEELSAKLAEVEKRADELLAQKDEGGRVEEELRREVETLNQTIAKLREELDGGRTKLADLERQFEETSAATAAATDAMAGENELLKDLLARAVREQAKRQQARKLVAEELGKLQVRSEDLLERFDALADAEVELTPEERKLLRKPEPAVAMKAGSNGFELVAGRDQAGEEVPAELTGQLKEAQQAVANSDFSRARALYTELARQAPDSYVVALSLGMASHQLQDYAGAIESYRKALEIKPNEPAALTNLGISELRKGELDDAKASLQKANDNGPTYLSHYFLGVTLQKNGEKEAAMEEARKSLDLNPDYQPAIQLEQDLQASRAPAPSAAASPAR